MPVALFHGAGQQRFMRAGKRPRRTSQAPVPVTAELPSGFINSYPCSCHATMATTLSRAQHLRHITERSGMPTGASALRLSIQLALFRSRARKSGAVALAGGYSCFAHMDAKADRKHDFEPANQPRALLIAMRCDTMRP